MMDDGSRTIHVNNQGGVYVDEEQMKRLLQEVVKKVIDRPEYEEMVAALEDLVDVVQSRTHQESWLEESLSKARAAIDKFKGAAPT